MTTFAVTLHLTVEGPDELRRDHFERVTDAYAALEAIDARLLDCSWGYADRGDHGEIDVDLTVVAKDKASAFELASAAAWSAIHDAGGVTAGRAERLHDPGQVRYRMTDETVELVLA
ncbi:MAG: hypothetical protein JO079_06140 [Frankiaceae bacterium]|nr:hypothetical protein [Frankiaceae bacterium]MBV9368203.1 hypothetical protein [Frankiales bacterium]